MKIKNVQNLAMETYKLCAEKGVCFVHIQLNCGKEFQPDF